MPSDRPETTGRNIPREWMGWQTEAKDALGDARSFIHSGHADIAIQCLERAMIILREKRL